jgi:hypothetical protein
MTILKLRSHFASAIAVGLAVAALGAPTEDTLMYSGGYIEITSNPHVHDDIGLRLEVTPSQAFGSEALLCITVVNDQPYRTLGVRIPLASRLAVENAKGVRVQIDSPLLVAVEPGLPYSYVLLNGATQETLFELSDGEFTYDADTQQLTLANLWLRLADSLAQQLGMPDRAGNLAASLTLKADMTFIRSDPFDGPTPSGPSGGGGPRAGADIVWRVIQDTSHFGPVGGIHAYIYGTTTCNMGTASLAWINGGTPAASMNMFRLHNGRLMQIGMGFGKTACCVANGSGCGITCQSTGGAGLRPGCQDVYSSGFNSNQAKLLARSRQNAFTGAMQTVPTGSGDAIWRRCQVAESDMSAASNPGALFFTEGIYVCTEDAVAGNRNNNASYRRCTIGATYLLTLNDATVVQPCITAWRLHGLGLNTPDNRVVDGILDVPGEGRFHTVYKVADNGNGTWTYDYAIYNLSSDVSGGSFEVPVPSGVAITNIGFHDVLYHSGDPYDNTDWPVTVGNGTIRWQSPQSFTQNANSNALRWGTQYNFWFTATRPPAAGNATLGLFNPYSPQSLSFPASVPSAPPCVPSDLDCDGDVDVDDLALLLANYACVEPPACIGDINNDGRTDVDDLSILLSNYGT